MPREFRKRGRGGRRPKPKKDQDPPLSGFVLSNPQSALNSQDVIEIALQNTLPIQQNKLPENSNSNRIFPELTPDLKAYWKQVDERIQELERLGVGGRNIPAGPHHDDEEDEEDERHLLLRSALSELSGHEVALATDPETSIILERIIYSLDDFAKRVLVDRLIGSFVDLCDHRHASHVIQTLLALSASVLDQEARNEHLNSVVQSNQDQQDLPSMSLLLSQAAEDLIPHLSRLSSNPSGCHVLHIMLLLIFGKPIAQENYRSRNSSAWRSKKGHFKSLFSSNSDQLPSSRDLSSRQVPLKLQSKANELYQEMKLFWSNQNGTYLRSAASNPFASVLLQLMVELEFEKGQAETQNSLTDILLDGLIQNKPSYPRSEFVEVCLRDVTASRVIEGIISHLSPIYFKRFCATYFVRRFGQLACHPVVNFIIAKAISRLEKEELFSALEECKPKMINCIDNFRIGPLTAFINRSIILCQSEQQSITKSILKAFGIEQDEDYRYAFPCLIALTRLEYFRKTVAYKTLSSNPAASQSELKLPESNVQGSLLLQGILQLDFPDLSTKLIKALMSLPLEFSMALSHDPIGSRTLDAFLNSPSTTPASRRQFILRFIADVYLKEKIATSLVGHQIRLQQSQFGHFFISKVDLPLFERQRDAWKTKMAAKFPPRTLAKPPISRP
ncbi:hypothetical protein O181_086535 [Austropuccinia psidii MF-1]|uniref:Nucleolar protein 9 n=1 Tax=Austropuccinia psidii MF-1 TaxID=1389203 RepID=A0A9Q3INB6_9BASI|nr:hypothetical protein [Austropuccinia psidii MF-1]